MSLETEIEEYDHYKINGRWVLKKKPSDKVKSWLEQIKEEERKVAEHINYLNSLNKPTLL
jgi:hypothetical protein